MNDLTKGSVPRHLVQLALPIAIGMVFQTLYVLVDLYFVAQLGDAAIAGVGAAGNVQFIVMALTQILGVGSMALIAQAVGRRDGDDANLVFNQSLLLAAACGVATLLGGYFLAPLYMGGLGADAETIAAGHHYLQWFLPGLALQFALVSMGSALRGTGIVKPTMVVQMVSVLINAVLDPILIVGWLTGRPLGVAGAGLASTISIALAVGMMAFYFRRLETVVGLDPAMVRPRLPIWRRILQVGLPPGGEFALLFVYMAFIYWIIRDFGASAQAGFGLGQRVMQSIFLPAMAIAFAVAPLAGQNFGAGNAARVRETLRVSTWMGSAMMLVLSLFCQWRPDALIGFFTDDPSVIATGGQFLHIVSWNFIATGFVFTCSGMFQAMGNTLPALFSSASRLFTFVLPALLLASLPGFTLERLWTLSVTSVWLQAALSLYLVRAQLTKRLARLVPVEPAEDLVPASVAPEA